MKTQEQSVIIGKEIMNQIGRKALVMLGATSICAGTYNDGPGLAFKVRASRTVKIVRVILAIDDTYTMQFLNAKHEQTEVKVVYCDMLHSILAEKTGCSLSIG